MRSLFLYIDSMKGPFLLCSSTYVCISLPTSRHGPSNQGKKKRLKVTKETSHAVTTVKSVGS